MTIHFHRHEPEASIWRRFAPPVEAFAVSQEGALTVVRVGAPAERVLDHLHALAAEMPDFVDVTVEDLRTGRTWGAEARALSDVRESIAQHKDTFARYGGVELAIYTQDDQLTLTPHLEFYIYARTDRWVYLLQGRGLEERTTLPGRSWRMARDRFPEAPESVAAAAEIAARLGLVLT